MGHASIKTDSGNGAGAKMKLTAETVKSLTRNPLFAGMTPEECYRAADFFSLSEKDYLKDTILVSPGQGMTYFGIVLCGSVTVYMDDLDGNQMIMAHVGEGESFGEALCYLQVQDAPIYAAAVCHARVAWLSAHRLRNPSLSDPLSPLLVHRFIAMLSRRALHMNDRIQVLSKKTLREKLVTFFTQCEHQFGSRTFRIPFSRYDLSVYLGTNRSALSRELSRMKQEGMIDYYRDAFRLL